MVKNTVKRERNRPGMPKGRETQERMLRTAARLMQEHGYNGTGMKQIVQESGTPWGSVYFHFPGGKEQLATDALHTVGANVREMMRAAMAAENDPGDALLAFIDMTAGILRASDFRRGCPCATVALEEGAESTMIRNASRDVYASWQEIIAERLAVGGMDAGQANELAGVVLSAFEGALILCRVRRSTEPLEAVGRYFASVVRAAM